MSRKGRSPPINAGDVAGTVTHECNADAMIQSMIIRMEAMRSEVCTDHECAHSLLKVSTRFLGESMGMGSDGKRLLEQMVATNNFSHIPIAITAMAEMRANELRAMIDFIEHLLVPEMEKEEISRGYMGEA
jgi:hypothetical protein